ncbi:hypothetical protein RQP46_010409 [Phenoliferia psychrophenolica]
MHLATPLLSLGALASAALAHENTHHWDKRSSGHGAIPQEGLMARMHGGMAKMVKRVGEAAMLVAEPATNATAPTNTTQTLAVANSTDATNPTASLYGAVQQSTGTWFTPDTTALTACNTYLPDTTGYYVAVNLNVWGANDGIPNADVCGKTVVIQNTDTKITLSAIAWDNNAQANWTAVSLPLYKALGANTDVGEFPMTFFFRNATGTNTEVSSASNATVSNATVASTSASSSLAPVAIALASLSTADVTTEAAPSTAEATTTATPTSTYDWASAASASSASAASAEKAAAAAAAASSADAEAWAASSSSSAAAAAASKAAAAKQQQEWDSEAAASSSSAAAAAASSKAAAKQQAQWDAEAAASSSSAAAAAASSAAAKKSSSSSSSSSGGSTYTGGVMTYFTQNGVAGACGTVHSDSGYGVALYTSMYANGANCGRKILAKNSDTGASVTVTVWDECPTCNGATSVDFSEAAFLQLCTINEGECPLTWSFTS